MRPTRTARSSWRSASATSSSTPANWTPGRRGLTTLSRSTSTATTEATIRPGVHLSLRTTGQPRGFPAHRRCRGPPIHPATGFTDADWKVGTSRTADGYIVEFEIPLALIDTRDGPESVPATSGSELLVNFGVTDNDAPVSDQTDYGIFWAEDPGLSPQEGGEDFWTVSLRLVPRPVGP